MANTGYGCSPPRPLRRREIHTPSKCEGRIFAWHVGSFLRVTATVPPQVFFIRLGCGVPGPAHTAEGGWRTAGGRLPHDFWGDMCGVFFVSVRRWFPFFSGECMPAGRTGTPRGADCESEGSLGAGPPGGPMRHSLSRETSVRC